MLPTGWMVTAVIPVILVTQREIVEILPKGRRRRIRFDQIKKVEHGHRIHDMSGKTIVIWRGTSGYDDLAEVLLERVPRDRIECVHCLERDKRSAYRSSRSSSDFPRSWWRLRIGTGRPVSSQPPLPRDASRRSVPLPRFGGEAS